MNVHKCLMSHTDESCLVYEWVVSHVKREICQRTNACMSEWKMNMCRTKMQTRKRLMSHTNESGLICEWVVSHVNESCHIWMSHVICEWVMSHMNESCHMWMSHVTCEWVMSHVKDCHIWVSHVTCETGYAIWVAALTVFLLLMFE